MSRQLIAYICEHSERGCNVISIPMLVARYADEGYSTTEEMIHDALTGAIAHLRQQEMMIFPVAKFYIENRKMCDRRCMNYAHFNVPSRNQSEEAGIDFAVQCLPIGKPTYGVRIARVGRWDYLWRVWYCYRTLVTRGVVTSTAGGIVLGLKNKILPPSEANAMMRDIIRVVPEVVDTVPGMTSAIKSGSKLIADAVNQFPRPFSRSRRRRDKMRNAYRKGDKN